MLAPRAPLLTVVFVLGWWTIGGWAWAAPTEAHPATTNSWRWMLSDFAPISMRHGPAAGTGYAQRMLVEVLWPALPGHEHTIDWMSIPRIAANLRAAPDGCGMLFRKTPQRTSQWSYSLPLIRHLPVGLVVRQPDLDRLKPLLNDKGEIRLSQYLIEGHTVGIIGSRAHGSAIDELLAQRPHQNRNNQLLSASRAILSMLQRRHGIDSVLAYSFELQYFNRQDADTGANSAPLSWLPIEEQSASLLAHVVCSPTAEGRRHIEALNTVLIQPGIRERLQALYEAWLEEPERQRLLTLRRQMGPRFFDE